MASGWLSVRSIFPSSLTCGPAGAALVAGNTVITKPSVETAWAVRVLSECFRDAEIPDGVFNYVTGLNEALGQAILDHSEIDGITFTGSYEVGMKIYRENAQFRYPRPVILEMGGFVQYGDELSQAGRILTGGNTLTHGALAKGSYCEPTVVVDVPRTHHLWKHEMFVPLVMIDRVKDLDEACALANDVDYGLTSGFFGTRQEAQYYLDRIQAGVVYVNREHGATTGAWPGYQSFGGWKGSGCSGKGSGGPYYLLSYVREQSQTIID